MSDPHLLVIIGSTRPGRVGKPVGDWFARFAAIDNRVSSRTTREELGWEPTGPGLIADIDRPAYFAS